MSEEEYLDLLAHDVRLKELVDDARRIGMHELMRDVKSYTYIVDKYGHHAWEGLESIWQDTEPHAGASVAHDAALVVTRSDILAPCFSNCQSVLGQGSDAKPLLCCALPDWAPGSAGSSQFAESWAAIAPPWIRKSRGVDWHLLVFTHTHGSKCSAGCAFLESYC
jgi:hypothetical protein